MKIDGNTTDGPVIVPPMRVVQGNVVFEAAKPRDNRNIIGMLSKYTDRTDLSTLISDRNAW